METLPFDEGRLRRELSIAHANVEAASKHVAFLEGGRQSLDVSPALVTARVELSIAEANLRRVEESIPGIRPLQAAVPDEAEAKPAPLFSEFVREHTNRVKENGLSPKSIRTEGTEFRAFVLLCGDKPLNAYTVLDAENFKAKRSKVSKWTGRKGVAVMHHIFNEAARIEGVTTTPFAGVKKPRPQEIDPPVFTPENIVAVRAKLKDATHGDMLVVDFYTGLRLGELTRLEWEDIDFDREGIRVRHHTKNGKNRTVPMYEEVRKVLDRRVSGCKSPSGYVFTKPGGFQVNGETVSKAVKKAIREAGLDDRLHFHLLRHSCFTMLAEAGIDALILQAISGHSDLKVLLKYVHIRGKAKGDAMDRLPPLPATV